MFDNVVIDYPLPDGFRPTQEFQTKNLACEMRSYRITGDGQLILHPYVTDGMPYKVLFTGDLDAFHDATPAEWHEYRFRIVDGDVIGVHRLSAPRGRQKISIDIPPEMMPRVGPWAPGWRGKLARFLIRLAQWAERMDAKYGSHKASSAS